MPERNESEKGSEIEEIFNNLKTVNDEPEDPQHFLSIGEVDPTSIGTENEDGTHEVPDYAMGLGEREAVSGDIHCIKIKVQNDGERTFPGGELTDISLSSGFQTFSYEDINSDIAELAPGEKDTMHVHLNIGIEGAVTFKGKIASIDQSLVQIQSSEPEPNVFTFGLRAIPRERLQMLTSLENIKEGLNNVE